MAPEQLSSEPIVLLVAEEDAGTRLDVFLAAQLPRYSRVHLRKVINAAGVKVDGARTKAAFRLRTGQRVAITLPDLPVEGPQPEDVPLDVLYEDDCLVAINKPPGMVVHPSKGHWSGTLTAALAFRFERLSAVGGPSRPGIVHRLDRDTSGVIVVAKSDPVHIGLAKQFEQRTVEKQYFAIVAGNPDRDADVIQQPIGVHPYQREKMAIRAGHPTSRDASTFYEVQQRFGRFAAVHVVPKTGRTHQIRVHLAHMGCPVLCDPLYGGRDRITRGELHGDRHDAAVLLNRTALHAQRLLFTHPTSGERVTVEAPLPADLAAVLDELRSAKAG
jgi:23S rRNA pseudouridine1911/1915/1917 synthase